MIHLLGLVLKQAPWSLGWRTINFWEVSSLDVFSKFTLLGWKWEGTAIPVTLHLHMMYFESDLVFSHSEASP